MLNFQLVQLVLILIWQNTDHIAYDDFVTQTHLKLIRYKVKRTFNFFLTSSIIFISLKTNLYVSLFSSNHRWAKQNNQSYFGTIFIIFNRRILI